MTRPNSGTNPTITTQPCTTRTGAVCDRTRPTQTPKHTPTLGQTRGRGVQSLAQQPLLQHNDRHADRRPMPEQTLNDDTHYRILRHLADNPGTSQRELAREFGISVGKVNYCLKALLDKGYIKATNFKNSKNKRAYLYRLTPAGITAKSRTTIRFLARKQAEYERLAAEIEQLRQEAHSDDQ